MEETAATVCKQSKPREPAGNVYNQIVVPDVAHCNFNFRIDACQFKINRS